MNIHDTAETARRKVYDDELARLRAELDRAMDGYDSATLERDDARGLLAARDVTILTLQARIAELEAAEPTRDPWDYDDDHAPWAYDRTDVFTAGWTDKPRLVPLATTGATFWDRLTNTLNAAKGRVVVDLPDGVHRFTSFRPAGTTGGPAYAFGFYHPWLKGFRGNGADKCFIEMAPNSMTQAQLDILAGYTMASFQTNQMAVARIDGTTTDPVRIAGVTVRAADQNPFTSRAADLQHLFYPQPAPHTGLMLYSQAGDLAGTVSYSRIQGAGRALNSQPPFEHGNILTGKGTVVFDHCDIDGRRSPDIDPAQPRRCAPLLGNSEKSHTITDSWIHGSNLGRYAINDQHSNTRGTYALVRTKVEQISDNQNRDPKINGGKSLGGQTNASLLGWETTAGNIVIEDCILIQDNGRVTKDDKTGKAIGAEWSAHVQCTEVTDARFEGGTMTIRNVTFVNRAIPELDGYPTLRISQDSSWWKALTDGRIKIHHKDGHLLVPHVVTGAWPPKDTELTAAGVTRAKYYLVRRA